jgi:hypothetical protein
MPPELPEQCCGSHHGGYEHHNQLAQLHHGFARYKASKYAWVQARKFENAVQEEEGRPSRSTHTHTHTNTHTCTHAHTHTHEATTRAWLLNDAEAVLAHEDS